MKELLQELYDTMQNMDFSHAWNGELAAKLPQVQALINQIEELGTQAVDIINAQMAANGLDANLFFDAHRGFGS